MSTTLTPDLTGSQLTPTIERSQDGTPVISSEVIAEGAGVEHRAVLQLLSTSQEDFEQFGPLAFEMRKGQPLPQGGFAKSTRIALLNEQQATLLMTFQRNTEQVKRFKVMLVKAFYELARPALSGPALMAAALIEAQQTLESKDRHIATLEPKAAYVDHFVADNDLLKVSDVAANLYLGEHLLRNLLLAADWIYKETQRRRNSKGIIVTEYRYSEYSHKKPYFHRTKNHHCRLFKGTLDHTLHVTPAGASAIARLVNKHIAAHGSVEAAVIELERVKEERRPKLEVVK